VLGAPPLLFGVDVAVATFELLGETDWELASETPTFWQVSWATVRAVVRSVPLQEA